MNIYATVCSTVCSTVLLACSAWGRNTAAPVAPTVNVCIEYDSEPRAVQIAQSVATRLLAATDVNLRWQTGFRACPANGVRITLAPHSTSREHPGAYGYASPYEKSRIHIFADRIAAAEPGPAMAQLLGHVLAHEITHILQAIVRHSETRLMRAHWSPEDHVRMRQHLLGWDATDREIIHAGLATR